MTDGEHAVNSIVDRNKGIGSDTRALFIQILASLSHDVYGVVKAGGDVAVESKQTRNAFGRRSG